MRLAESRAFGSFTTDDIDAARTFYRDVLGLEVTEEMGILGIGSATGGWSIVYPKGADHVPAAFTVLNFPVADIDAAVDALAAKGIAFERYPGFAQDERAIVRGRARGEGPDIAWFKDPAGNVLSVLSDDDVRPRPA